MTLSNKRITKTLIRLRGCEGWSAPLLFANTEDRFSSIQAHIIMKTACKKIIFFFDIVVGTQKNRLNETVLLILPKHLLKLIGKEIFTILRSKF